MKTAAVVVASVLILTAHASARDPLAVSNDTTHILWRDPGPIAAKDLTWGVGSADRAPKPPFTFVKEDTSGTKPKIEIVDASGVEWTVKLAPAAAADNEVHAEIAASRLVWALGFFVEEHYFVPEGQLAGVKGLTRAASLVSADGRFSTARFARRDRTLEDHGSWNIESNRFKGTRELSALQAMTMLLGNWDLLPDNTEIVRVTLPNGDVEARYLVSDLGTSFGRMGGGVGEKHSRWNLDHYRRDRFLNGVVMARLVFAHPLTGSERIAIPIEHARWFADLAGALTPAQVRAAFEAAGATASEVDGFSAEVIKRVQALRTATHPKTLSTLGR
jgi:hypothetical protein